MVVTESVVFVAAEGTNIVDTIFVVEEVTAVDIIVIAIEFSSVLVVVKAQRIKLLFFLLSCGRTRPMILTVRNEF